MNNIKSVTKELMFNLYQTRQSVLVEEFFTVIDANHMGENKKEAFTLLLKLEELGFTPSKDLLCVFSNATSDELKNFWDFAVKNLKMYSSAAYEPMYPNFPKQTIEMSELELMTNALVHYVSGSWFDERWVPETVKKARKKLKGKYNPKELSMLTTNDLVESFSNFISSNAVLSPTNKTIVELMSDYLSVKKPNEVNSILKSAIIPQKENLAFFAVLAIKDGYDFVNEDNFNNPTDLLRLAAELSSGDASLTNKTRYQNISRSNRKKILSLLNNMFEKTNDSEQFLSNMFQREEMWKKLSHYLHAGEYKYQYPLAVEAINKVRNGEKVFSYGGKVEFLINNEKFRKIIDLLQERPGVFARKLHEVLIKSGTLKKQERIVNGFFECAYKVSTPVLLQLQARFKNYFLTDNKVVMPKSSKIFVIENEQRKLPKEIVDSIVQKVESVLIDRFSHGSNLGNVYLDENLRTQNIPFAARSASKAIKTVARGSRWKKESEHKVMRFFIWWNEQGKDKNGEVIRSDRIDLDLSVAITDKNGEVVAFVSYYQLKEGDFILHSGDLTSAPNGAAEYVDVDLEKLKEVYPYAEYIVPLVSSYSNQDFAEMPECYAGWMERESFKRGEIFEPKTVQNKVDLVSNSTQIIIAIYDMKNNEYIWADLPVKQRSYYSNNLHSLGNNFTYAVKGLVEMKKPVLFDLFEMHAKARGTIVQDKNDADVIFSLNDGITPFDFEVIAAEFMADSFEKPKVKSKP